MLPGAAGASLGLRTLLGKAGGRALPTPIAGFGAEGRKLENLEPSLRLVCAGAPWRAWKWVIQCQHLAQQHQGMLLPPSLAFPQGLQ